jgi:hypothetical protein
MQEKTKLLEAIAGRNRGLRATEMDRINILTAVEHLEDLNPNAQPLNNQSLLDGNWRLLYTTSRNLLGLDRFPLIDWGKFINVFGQRNLNSTISLNLLAYLFWIVWWW